MSVWNATSPDDLTYLANTIHTQIQADKVMISGRFEGNDGTIESHKAKDSDDSGIHEASKVGWVKVHATIAARDTWATANPPLVEGSLHFVTDVSTLYLVDTTLAFLQIFPVDHLLLADRDTGDDHNYQDVDLSKSFTGDLKIASLTINDATVAGNTDPLDEATHAALDWEAAHGAATLHGDHVAAAALIVADVCAIPHSASATAEVAHAANTYGWPWHAGDGNVGDNKFHELEVSTTGFAYKDGAAFATGTIYAGKFKL